MPIHQFRDGRVKLTGKEYQQMRRLLCDLAGSHCEVCGKFTGMASGEADHVILRGLGGGRRDDRVFVDGKRQLLWKCSPCHNGRHNPKACPPKSEKLDDQEFKQLLGMEER